MSSIGAPPFIWEEEGEAKGIYVDILKEALENRMQTPIQFLPLPYKRILSQLEIAGIDGVVGVSTPELLTFSRHEGAEGQVFHFAFLVFSHIFIAF